MNFLKYDLGNLTRGEVVEVTLTNGANVRLMDSSNFNSYKNGRKHRFYGGLAKKSPLRIAVPNSGHWYVAVDMQGLRGSTNASVRVVPGALPEIQERPLSEVPAWYARTFHRLLKLAERRMMYLSLMLQKIKKISSDHLPTH